MKRNETHFAQIIEADELMQLDYANICKCSSTFTGQKFEMGT